jgi:hypothetical protein
MTELLFDKPAEALRAKGRRSVLAKQNTVKIGVCLDMSENANQPD